MILGMALKLHAEVIWIPTR